MNRIQILTIGYSSAFPKEVLYECTQKGIKTIVDIRSIPFGRRKQWNRDELTITCESFGIDYVYRGKTLGFPKEFWGIENWKEKYCELIESSIDKIIADLKCLKQPIALLCVEKDYDDCHRSVLAKTIEKHDPEISCSDLEIVAEQKASRKEGQDQLDPYF